MQNQRGHTIVIILMFAGVVAAIALVAELVMYRHISRPAPDIASGTVHAPPSTPAGTYQDTYEYNDFMFPKIDAAYTRVGGSPDDSSGPPDIYYASDAGIDQMNAYVLSVCKAHKFTIAATAEPIMADQSSTGTAYRTQCGDSKNNWTFTVAASRDITHAAWVRALPGAAQQRIMAAKTALTVSSYGPMPIN